MGVVDEYDRARVLPCLVNGLTPKLTCVVLGDDSTINFGGIAAVSIVTQFEHGRLG